MPKSIFPSPSLSTPSEHSVAPPPPPSSPAPPSSSAPVPSSSPLPVSSAVPSSVAVVSGVVAVAAAGTVVAAAGVVAAGVVVAVVVVVVGVVVAGAAGAAARVSDDDRETLAASLVEVRRQHVHVERVAHAVRAGCACAPPLVDESSALQTIGRMSEQPRRPCPAAPSAQPVGTVRPTWPSSITLEVFVWLELGPCAARARVDSWRSTTLATTAVAALTLATRLRPSEVWQLPSELMLPCDSAAPMASAGNPGSCRASRWRG